MDHEIEGAVVVGEVGCGGDDVGDLVQLVDAAFEDIEWYDCSTSIGDFLLDLYGALAILLAIPTRRITSRRRASDRPLGIMVKLNSSKRSCDPSIMVTSSMVAAVCVCSE